jgi:WD40 repeat protein
VKGAPKDLPKDPPKGEVGKTADKNEKKGEIEPKQPLPPIIKKMDPIENPDPKFANGKDEPKENLLKNENLLKVAEISDKVITACFFSGDGKKIYVSTREGNLLIIDAATLEETKKHRILEGKIRHMTLQSKGPVIPERLYIMDEGGKVRVFDVDKGSLGKPLPTEKAFTRLSNQYRLTLTPDGGTLVVRDCVASKSIFWDILQDKENVPVVFRRPVLNATNVVQYSHDGRVGAAHGEKTLVVFNARNRQDIRNIDTDYAVTHLAISTEATAVIIGNEKEVHAYNYNSGSELWTANPHGDNPMTGIAAIPKCAGLVSVGFDQFVRVRDIRTGIEVAKWHAELPLQGVAVSPDGKLAASYSSRKLFLWTLPPVGGKNP